MWFFFHCSAFLNTALSGAQHGFYERLFQTGWFVESLLTQTLIVHIIRTRRLPFIGSRASLPMTVTTLSVMAIGAWLPYSPFAPALGVGASARHLLGLDRRLPDHLQYHHAYGQNLVLPNDSEVNNDGQHT